MRFMPTGERDKSFGAGGILRLPKCGNFDSVLALRDGRLMVSAGGCLAMLGANGQLDAHFGKHGVLEISGRSPTELPDGRIALARYSDKEYAELLTLSLPTGKSETVRLLDGPVRASWIAGVDGRGRALVDVGLHRYVTERTTEQESVIIMTNP